MYQVKEAENDRARVSITPPHTAIHHLGLRLHLEEYTVPF